MITAEFLKTFNFGKVLNRFCILDPHRRFVMNLSPNACLLDYGCGNADLMERFHQIRPDLKIVGVDILDFSDEVIRKGGRFRRIQREEDIKDFGMGRFDGITCLHVLEHIDVLCYQKLMQSFDFVLKKDGKILIETPHAKSIWIPSFSFLSSDGGPLNFYDDPTHVRPFTKPALEALVGQYFIIKKLGIFRNWVFLILSPIFIMFGGIISRRLLVIGLQNLLGWAVYCIAQKKNV